jgi:ComF family protein
MSGYSAPVLQIRWPSLCAVCRGWSDARVCSDCVARFAPAAARCARCALPSTSPLCGACLAVPPHFASALAAVEYAFPWDALITRFKFRGGLDLAPALAALLVADVRRTMRPLPSLIVPIPLGPARLRERGYNQAWELARRVGRALRCKTDPRLLLRTVDTPHQLSLARGERARNVRGSFAVDARGQHQLRGLDIALVDDVMTTGATAGEAAQVLLQAGAASVSVWVVARTPAPEAA